MDAMAAFAEVTLESAPEPAADPTAEPPVLDDVRGLRHADGLMALDRRLHALCRERGPLRVVMARIAWRLVIVRAWERIGYARLSDYAVERLGLSARWVQSLAQVGEGFRVYPGLEEALVSGTLGWTKVRLLASLPPGEDEPSWLARATRLTAEQLSKPVRAVDRGSIDAAEANEATGHSRVFEARCSPDVRWKWYAARGAASRAAGRMLHVAEAAELIAAEVLSALPLDEDDDAGQEACDEAGVSWSPEAEEEAGGSEPFGTGSGREEDAAPADRSAHAPPLVFVEGLEQADAFELDERFRRALSMEQRLDARVGPLLTLAWDHWVHRGLGYPTREAYARERLGMDPTRARALVRLERAAVLSEPFARAYRTGALSWVKAGVLVPLVSSDRLGRFMEDWVAWANRVTVRRLRDDVEWAVALEETDPVAFAQSGGLPPEARGEGGTRNDESGPSEHDGGRDREIGAPQRESAEETCSVRFIGPADVVQLFRAVLCTVRRRMEGEIGRLPTEGEALGVMLDHVLSSWGALDTKVAARHRVFDRDGWRCAAPGCTSMQNLHDHHIRFRSAGGSDAPENRVTLCAFHHLRGVHAERLRCVGQAPDGLTWQMGIRPGAAPLIAYRSGDLQVTAVPS
jgi:hypothetical protein